jgi:aminomethyltransferase
VKLGARLVPFAGYEMPVQYKGVTEEHKAVRNAAGLFDVSHMGEIVLRGQHACEVVNYLITNDASRLADGQALYTCACNEHGTILDDLIVYRVDVERYLIVCNASNRTKIAAHFKAAAAGRCDFEDVSDATALVALQGPKALMIAGLAGSGGAALADLKTFHFRDTVLANVRCTVARTGYTGEDGIEIFCSPDDVSQLWRLLLDLGREHGLEAAGLGARDTLRLEARLSLYGNDIDETTNPLEAGLGWIVKPAKGDFVGRGAIEKVRASGPARKLVGIEMADRSVARHGYRVVGFASRTESPTVGREGAPTAIGIITSGSYGPSVERSIALAYVPSAQAAIGTEVGVEIRNQAKPARVVKTPFHPSRVKK